MAARLRPGSCHCGAVRFEAAVVPRADFRLVAGAEALSEYRCNTRTEAHLFCATCGIRVFGTGTSPRRGEYVAVSVACLDDATDEELARVAVTYLDGRNDDWDAAPREVRHL